MTSPHQNVHCARAQQVVGGGASVGDYSLGYSSLCTFKDAADVKSGYTEQSAILNGTIVTHYVDPSYVTVALYNGGEKNINDTQQARKPCTGLECKS